jgi:hypothetical protein
MNKWLAVFVQVFPAIVTLMGVAERAFGNKPKSGADKKAMVMEATKAIVCGITAASTGGQADTWAKIEKPVSNIIDNAAAIVFPEEAQR